MTDRVVYVPMPQSVEPQNEGYYIILDNENTKHPAAHIYWTGTEWRYYKNVKNHEPASFSHWLKPIMLSELTEQPDQYPQTLPHTKPPQP